MKLMKEERLSSRGRMKKYRFHRGTEGMIAPNRLSRQFHAARPHMQWVTDITEFKLFGEKLCLSPILDLFNGEVISYTLLDRPVLKLVTDLVEAAFEKLRSTNSDNTKNIENPTTQPALILQF